MGSGKTDQTGRCRAALYMRLSKDDEKGVESASITAQREMLRAYARENGYDVYGEYTDDGFPGTTFDRPGFQRMLRDIEDRKVNMVITKDLSRLGRDYILTGQYTEIYFPARRVRYIAVNDGYDSDSPYTDLAPFQNVVNEMYARDTSRKIRSALKARMKEGEFVGAFAPYGYRRDDADKHLLVADEEAAKVVREIFRLASLGTPPGQIAESLNGRGIKAPIVYRCQNNPSLDAGRYGGKRMWSSPTVSRILHNEVYLGHLAQGKTAKVSFKSGMSVRNPREDWIVVPDTHEPLVSRQAFEAASSQAVRRSCGRKGRFANVFSGIAKCSDCGRNMSSVGTRKKGALANLACGGYKLYGAGKCTNHFIDYETLCRIVLSSIREQLLLDRALREEILREAKRRIQQRTVRKNGETEAMRLEKRARELEYLVGKLYEDHVSGRLGQEHMNMLLARYESESMDIAGKLAKKKKRDTTEKGRDVRKELDRLLNRLTDVTDITVLRPELLHRFIDHIEVGQGVWQKEGRGRAKRQDITIFYRFKGEPFDRTYRDPGL